MIKLAHVMLYFHCIRSPWQRANIFWYSPSSSKNGSFAANIGKREKRKRKYTALLIEYLQTGFLKATQPLQTGVVLLKTEVVANPVTCWTTIETLEKGVKYVQS